MRRIIGTKRIIWILIINAILIVFLSLTTPYFMTKDNLIAIVDNLALEVIILSGYSLLLISGWFDLSVDGIVAVSGVVAGLLMVNSGVHWAIASIIGLLLGAGIGYFNSIIVVKMNVNGLIATLTTWWICAGFSLGMTKALSPYGFPEAFQFIGQTRFFGFRSIAIYAIIIFLVITLLLHFHKVGMYIYASGGSKKHSALIGLDIENFGMKLYVLMGLLSGLVGLLIASRLNASSPVAVDGMALRVIAAIVIGGGNLSGGEGTTIGGLLGLITMHILNNAIIQFGISPYWQKALLGGILLAAVLAERKKSDFSL